MGSKLQLACAYSFVMFAALFALGVVVLAGFIPPPHPAETALQIKHQFEGNLTGIRVGMVLTMIAVVFLLPWGAVVAFQLRRIEPGATILTWIQMGCCVIVTMIGVLLALVWGVAAFRPDAVSADVTRMLNDSGWFLFLFDWPPVALWYASVGLAILQDKREQPLFPRWAGYLCFWCVALSVPSSLIVFFKHGPFGYNGLIALYVAVGVLFAWFIVITWFVIRAINAEHAAPTDLLLSRN